MSKKTYQESSGRGGMLWLLQRISAVVIFILLMIHFVTYHFISAGNIVYDQVVAKMASPWFNLTQIVFLIAGLFHGLNGIWMVSEDYIHSRNGRMAVFSLLILLGLMLLFVGTSTVLKMGRP